MDRSIQTYLAYSPDQQPLKIDLLFLNSSYNSSNSSAYWFLFVCFWVLPGDAHELFLLRRELWPGTKGKGLGVSVSHLQGKCLIPVLSALHFARGTHFSMRRLRFCLAHFCVFSPPEPNKERTKISLKADECHRAISAEEIYLPEANKVLQLHLKLGINPEAGSKDVSRDGARERGGPLHLGKHQG